MTMNKEIFNTPVSTQMWVEARTSLMRHAVATGRTFTLKSGRESDFYVDCRVAALMSTGFMHLTYISRLMDWLLGTTIERNPAFGGWAPVPLGGVLLMLRTEISKTIVVPRSEQKEHGMKHKVEGLLNAQGIRLLAEGAGVYLIEDVI